MIPCQAEELLSLDLFENRTQQAFSFLFSISDLFLRISQLIIFDLLAPGHNCHLSQPHPGHCHDCSSSEMLTYNSLARLHRPQFTHLPHSQCTCSLTDIMVPWISVLRPSPGVASLLLPLQPNVPFLLLSSR